MPSCVVNITLHDTTNFYRGNFEIQLILTLYFKAYGTVVNIVPYESEKIFTFVRFLLMITTVVAFTIKHTAHSIPHNTVSQSNSRTIILLPTDLK